MQRNELLIASRREINMDESIDRNKMFVPLLAIVVD